MYSYTNPIKIGVISPISKIDEQYDEKHWASILRIIKNSFPTHSGYEISLVSDGVGAHYILTTIIKNIFSSNIIICDITCSNPNVMWELGVAMTMNKPVIIIKEDSNEKPPFDISGFQYITYPKHLRKSSNSRKKLKEKIFTTSNMLYAKSLQGKHSFFGIKSILDEKDEEIRKLKEKILLYEELELLFPNYDK